ncbi:DUF1840 domain-containing protein [Uliginosibacterium gangwonense]|uniref:DUF1840 domain-containing protein n=1 Tax=Uliginosibacterium gangwonense TaxID=392736 RepID=UPI00036F7A32|nr:DUF1840 domain-containing protein [Uliginosibacterium gangwonense]
MLITFYSNADADVIMFGEVGRAMLAVLGKDPQARDGIVTVEQLPAALAALQAAIDADHRERSHRAVAAIDTEEEDEHAARNSIISFAQRAYPLLTMLQYSIREKAAVTWHASGSCTDK